MANTLLENIGNIVVIIVASYLLLLLFFVLYNMW